MRIPDKLTNYLYKRIKHRLNTKPDFVVPYNNQKTYMDRWYLIKRNKILNNYLHRFNTPDPDKVLHDHPWFSLSIVLKGFYVEHTISYGGVNNFEVKRRGEIILRSPWFAHRIDKVGKEPCITIFITGPVLRDWGFHGSSKWTQFKEYKNKQKVKAK